MRFVGSTYKKYHTLRWDFLPVSDTHSSCPNLLFIVFSLFAACCLCRAVMCCDMHICVLAALCCCVCVFASAGVVRCPLLLFIVVLHSDCATAIAIILPAPLLGSSRYLDLVVRQKNMYSQNITTMVHILTREEVATLQHRPRLLFLVG